MTSRLRFGVVNESVPGGPAWLDHVRRVEDGGIDVFLVRDHFSAPRLLVGAGGPRMLRVAARHADLVGRERFGLSYLVTSDRALPALTEIIASL
jgi:alkanesulfonate monooxygenase SsuD/methylene tetrahydromethanopterin reductase-like flavin-dependent oxidoreductase (luciferase family)